MQSTFGCDSLCAALVAQDRLIKHKASGSSWATSQVILDGRKARDGGRGSEDPRKQMMLIPLNTGAACPLPGSNWRLNATQSGSDSFDTASQYLYTTMAPLCIRVGCQTISAESGTSGLRHGPNL
jgi:hypothetical protein